MNSALRARITQFHYQFQHELVPLIERDFGERLSPVLQRVVRTLECVQIERFVPSMRGLPGRPQRDRQALARAFVMQPCVLLADEPTGSLDFATGEAIIELMLTLNRERGTALILVTHDRAIAARCQRRITIAAGRVAAID